ncbi:hypothetical protein GCM10007972_05150 [Iodidimonas muriae]|uniref:Uncharacterized protein n=1 Tax=Iodidimonas muriae TaxID=261467 RepID=A0ABQ2L9N4_9PROT|nr:hypothetical protein JCM17843_00450 [Kordiimonadales bacterium JCM 17843]GGO06700.1 hypothetical protein GCM10007972_05150 [Iodidimonas muriae]
MASFNLVTWQHAPAGADLWREGDRVSDDPASKEPASGSMDRGNVLMANIPFIDSARVYSKQTIFIQSG